jgi:hypothetical protein
MQQIEAHLIQTARSQKSGIQLVGPVGGADNKDVLSTDSGSQYPYSQTNIKLNLKYLLGTHSIDFCQDLIEYPVAGATGIAR